MALLRTQQEKFSEAEAIYRELLRREPQYVPALNNLAELLALSGRQLDEARGLIEKAVELAGPQSGLLDTRASVYLALGKPEKAIDDLMQAVAEVPRPVMYFHIALAQQKAGKREEAAAALKKARDLGIGLANLHPIERPLFAQLAHASL
jgi:tetratricopeptide (TPR) repeat protein